MEMASNRVLPCRVSIGGNRGETLVGRVPPSDLLPLVSVDRSLATSAREVEATMKRVIDEAAG
jgi:hypothetical protein